MRDSRAIDLSCEPSLTDHSLTAQAHRSAGTAQRCHLVVAQVRMPASGDTLLEEDQQETELTKGDHSVARHAICRAARLLRILCGVEGTLDGGREGGDDLDRRRTCHTSTKGSSVGTGIHVAPREVL